MREYEGKTAQRLRGAAALSEALATIGRSGSDDHALAKVIVEDEMALRAFLNYGLACLSLELPK